MHNLLVLLMFFDYSSLSVLDTCAMEQQMLPLARFHLFLLICDPSPFLLEQHKLSSFVCR